MAICLDSDGEDKAICLDDDAKDKAVCLDSDGEDKAVCPDDDAKDKAARRDDDAKDKAARLDDDAKDKAARLDDDAKDKAGPQAAAVFGPQEEELERVPTVADGRCFWNALLLGTQTTAELELWKLRERNEQGFAVDPAICAQEVKMIKDFAMGLPLSSGAMKRIASAEMPEWSDMVEASKALQCNLVFYTGDAAGATCFIPEPMHAAWRTTKLYAGPSIDGAGHRASHFDLLLRIVAPEAAHKNPAAEATIQISELPDEPNPEERMMKRETDSPAPDTPVPSLPEEQGTINGECPVCRLVYYRIRKGEQCFDCRATLWTVDASSGKVVAPEACGNVQSAVTNLQARLSAEAATRLGAAIGEPVVVMGRDGALVKVALSSGDEAWVNEAEVQVAAAKSKAEPVVAQKVAVAKASFTKVAAVKCPFRLWRGAHSERMLKATSKHPCRKAVQRAAKLREMLANLPPSTRGDHAKRDARRWVQSSFVFKVKPFTRVAKETVDELQRDSVNPVRLTEEATCVLQAGLEAALARMYGDAKRCMKHANRRTLYPSDMRLAAQIRHDDGLFMNWRPAGPADPADARRRGFNM